MTELRKADYYGIAQVDYFLLDHANRYTYDTPDIVCSVDKLLEECDPEDANDAILLDLCKQAEELGISEIILFR